MKSLQVPGVYISESMPAPGAIVAVATAVPAFIGITQRAARGANSLLDQPTRIGSMDEYTALFGGAPDHAGCVEYARGASDRAAAVVTLAARFYLHAAMRMYFANGGGDCYITAVGLYDDITAAGGLARGGFAARCTAALAQLSSVPDVTLVLVPDAVLAGADAWEAITQQQLRHCSAQRRFAIIDVVDGDRPHVAGDDADAISGRQGLRARLGGNACRSYGAAYYPWLDTSLYGSSEQNLGWISAQSRAALLADAIDDARRLGTLDADLAALVPAAKGLDHAAAALQSPQVHAALCTASPRYRQVMQEALKQANVVPPAAAMAGVYARNDGERGVQHAPANVAIRAADSATVTLLQHEQDDLSTPRDGIAVNPIRAFPDWGLLVWGARTLDGNSRDWRYVSARRTANMVEQSLVRALAAYANRPNDSGTWTAIRTATSAFLENLWRAGVLAGSRADDAFSVAIGQGETMTGVDMLDKRLVLVVRLAVTRPAEFSELTLTQAMA